MSWQSFLDAISAKLAVTPKVSKIGIYLLIGIFVPIFCYIFTEPPESYDKYNGRFIANHNERLLNYEVVMKRGYYVPGFDGSGYYTGRFSFPYKYAAAMGIVFIFWGLSQIFILEDK